MLAYIRAHSASDIMHIIDKKIYNKYKSFNSCVLAELTQQFVDSFA